jgi:hypothetical protein
MYLPDKLGEANNLEQYYNTHPVNDAADGGLSFLALPMLIILVIGAYYFFFFLVIPLLPLSIIVYEFTNSITSNKFILTVSSVLPAVFMFIFYLKLAAKVQINEFVFYFGVYTLNIFVLFYLGDIIDNTAATGSVEKLNDIKDFFLLIKSWIFEKLG